MGYSGGVNLYGYVGNNPSIHNDPMGNWCLHTWFGCIGTTCKGDPNCAPRITSNNNLKDSIGDTIIRNTCNYKYHNEYKDINDKTNYGFIAYESWNNMRLLGETMDSGKYCGMWLENLEANGNYLNLPFHSSTPDMFMLRCTSWVNKSRGLPELGGILNNMVNNENDVIKEVY
jgi:hypothetical protein